jgi:hypothetical protein
MSTSARKSKTERTYPAITGLQIAADTITATLDDGREVSIPIAWSERLSKATRTQLKDFEIDPYGYGIHWEAIDEDISVKAFLDGWEGR